MIGIAVTCLLLLVLTAYLAAVETVLTRLNVVRALRLVDEEVRGAPALLWLSERRASSLNVVLLGTVSARVALSALAAVAGWELLGGPLGAVLAAVGVIVASLVVAEIAPRTLALRHLEDTGCRLAPSTRVLVRLVGPIATVVVGLGRALVPRREDVSGPFASDDELRQLEHDDEDHDDELEPEERAMIRSIFELADTIVREIMTPRPDMHTVSAGAALPDVIAVVLERGFSRLPVHDAQDPDRIVGIVYAKDVLRLVAHEVDPARPWDAIVRAPTFVPESKRCDELLRELQDATVHLALVVDEYGDLVGLVTIEDILEEIVGEIVDEHDHEEPLVEPLGDGRLRVDARLGVDDLNELLDRHLPEEGWDTVGGLVFATFGRVPEVDETVELDGVGLRVEQMQGRRVSKVLVTLAATDREDADTTTVPDPDGDEVAAGHQPAARHRATTDHRPAPGDDDATR
ncbi:MAG: HlyC/CorC family transporter [Nitriliruptoraceae bacterium]|nr:HlyC/CorC family transporter [Nitriliruptoraceae bacterium]